MSPYYNISANITGVAEMGSYIQQEAPFLGLAIWLFLYLALLALCFKGNMSTKKSLLVSGLPQLIIAGFLALIGWLNGVWLGISAFILLISVIGLFFDND